MSDDGYRVERDSMGELKVAASALWGPQTQRAINNVPISGLVMPRAFIRALGLIKWAAEGMRSSAFDTVMLSDLELSVASFQNRLRELLPVMALAQAPDAGSLKATNERLLTKDKVAAVG